jgi:hypothetical protein
MPNNDDVAHVELTATETAQVASKPVETTEPVKAVEPVADVKPVVKAEPVKEPPKPIKFDEVFAEEKPEKEVQEMTLDEKAEYTKLKEEKIISEHQSAFERELSVYADAEEREIIQNRLDKLLKKSDAAKTDFFDVLSGVLDPKKVAYIFTAIAEREDREALEKVRAKKLNTAVKQATKSAEVKKTLTEIGNLETIGDTGELSPAEKNRQMIGKARKADPRQREKYIDQLLKGQLS